MLGRTLILSLAVVLLCASCGEESEAEPSTSEQKQAQVSATDLGDVVLEATEAPPGTEYLAERSGTLRVDELWPSDCCPTQQMVFQDAGFSSAYARVFEKPGHTGDPIDTRPGWETVSSAAVLFRTEDGASTAMDSWLEYYGSPALEAVSAEGLGDEAVAVMGSPEAPAEVFFLYLWRIDRAVLNLRVSAGTGTVSVADVRALVDSMDSRVS